MQRKAGDTVAEQLFGVVSNYSNMIVGCLEAKDPHLRQSAIYKVPDLKSEKTARRLPLLFDDPYVLTGSYQHSEGSISVPVPPRQVCDYAAQAFNEVVPESPAFGGKTDEQQMKSIAAVSRWWQTNRDSLVWDSNRGILKLK